MVQKTKVSTLHELDKELNALIKALTTDNVDFEQKYGLISKSSLNTGMFVEMSGGTNRLRDVQAIYYSFLQ